MWLRGVVADGNRFADPGTCRGRGFLARGIRTAEDDIAGVKLAGHFVRVLQNGIAKHPRRYRTCDPHYYGRIRHVGGKLALDCGLDQGPAKSGFTAPDMTIQKPGSRTEE